MATVQLASFIYAVGSLCTWTGMPVQALVGKCWTIRVNRQQRWAISRKVENRTSCGHIPQEMKCMACIPLASFMYAANHVHLRCLPKPSWGVAGPLESHVSHCVVISCQNRASILSQMHSRRIQCMASIQFASSIYSANHLNLRCLQTLFLRSAAPLELPKSRLVVISHKVKR